MISQENFKYFKSNAEHWGIQDLEDIKKYYIDYMFRAGKPLYIITKSGRVHKGKGILIKLLSNTNIKFIKFINKEIYSSLYKLDKNSKKLYYELMEV